MLKNKIKETLSSKSKEGIGMRHFSRIVKPFKNGLFEMEDVQSGWYLIGSLDEAVEFLISA